MKALKRLKNKKAFTLIEMVITLGIIASIMLFGANVIGTRDAKMKDVSLNFIRVIRYIYSQAAVTNEYYRLVIDLNQQKYFAQVSATPFYVIQEGDEIEERRIENELKGSDAKVEEVAKQQAEQVGSFAESEDELLEMFEVPKGIRISDVFVMHQKDKAEEGKVYIYFFPKGLTEFAVIHLTHDSDEEEIDEENAMTLIVNPLTGSVDVQDEYVYHEDLLKDYGE
jgi:general secretion pathway protein H